MRTAVIVIAALCTIALLIPAPRYVPTEIDEGGLDRARLYLSSYEEPLPEGWQWHSYDYGGGQMRWGTAPNAQDRGTLIFVPGFSNFVEAYAPFINDWHDAGLTVIAIDLPGQGQSTRRADNPEKPVSGDFSWYAEQLGELIDDRMTAATSPVTVVGESFGAHVALRGLAEKRYTVDRLALVVPGLELKTGELPPGPTKAAINVLDHLGYGSRYVPTQGIWSPNWQKTADTFGCAVRPDRVYLKEAVYSLRPELRVGGITVEWAAGFDRSGRNLVRSGMLEGIDTDVFMVTAGDDEILDYALTYTACDEELPSCRRMELPGAGHCLLLEDDAVTDPMIEAVAAMALRE